MHTWSSGLVAVAVAAQAWVGVGSAPPVDAATGGFQSLAAPQRLLDTRPGEHTADAQQQGGGAVPAGGVIELVVGGRAGLPAAPAAVVLNVTVTDPQGPGFVTVYPCGARPNASTLNYATGQTVPNAVIATVSGGKVCLYTLAPAHLIVDASGWFPGGYDALASPARLLDTRAGQATVDGQHAGAGLVAAQSVYRLPVGGRGGLAAHPGTVVLNVAVTEPHGPGFVTVWPCGVDRPNASNINYGAGQTVPNLVVSKVGENDEVCIFTHAAAHLVVDVSGALPGSTFAALPAPARLADTRGDGATVDGGFLGAGVQQFGSTLQLDVTGRAAIPAEASAVVLNVTAVGAAGPGFLAVHPRGTDRPTASNVNYAAGQVVANAVVARLGQGGQVCLFNLAPTHVVVDVAGYLTGPPPPGSGAPCPSRAASDTGVRNALLRRPGLHDVHGVDLVAIVVCDLGRGYPTLDAAAIATWANQTVAPFFGEVSQGQFTVSFQAHPTPRIAATNSGNCLDQASGMTGSPFTNVIAVTEEASGAGFGGPGLIWSNSDTPVLAAGPPSVTSRGAWIGGGAALINPVTFVHEIGHTIHWPHSTTGNGDDYDNPVDIMSGRPAPGDAGTALWNTPYWCTLRNSTAKTPCWVQNTIAYNRFAAGWLTDQQVGVHWSGHANYSLRAVGVDGMQMVVVPDAADARRSLSIEARPRTGRDQYNLVDGVTVHLVDQASSNVFDKVSTDRRTAPAVNESNSYAHTVAVGETKTFHGVTVQVLQADTAPGFIVRVTGSYHAPALPGYEPPVVTTPSAGAVPTARDTAGPVLRRPV